MYYVWRYEMDESTPMYICGIAQFPGWEFVPWNMGLPINAQLPEPIRYYSDNSLDPPDYPRTGSIFHMLVSNGIAEVLKGFARSKIDYYHSEIVGPSGRVYPGYQTLNMWTFVDCIDYEKSDYEVQTKSGGRKEHHFKKLVLDESRIPSGINLFRLVPRKHMILVEEDLTRRLLATKASGAEFLLVSQYSDLG